MKSSEEKQSSFKEVNRGSTAGRLSLWAVYAIGAALIFLQIRSLF